MQWLIYWYCLEKVNLEVKCSWLVEFVIYYFDLGVFEFIWFVLLEGAGWWNEVFEVVGFIDVFQVKVLLEGVDFMDVCYNIINWVYCSIWGWFYGIIVVDLCIGEILKGYVFLGFFWVWQDFLIVQGLVEVYEAGEVVDLRLKEMALAWFRQFFVYEVGYMFGLVYNFVVSMNNCVLVMDYLYLFL